MSRRFAGSVHIVVWVCLFSVISCGTVLAQAQWGPPSSQPPSGGQTQYPPQYPPGPPQQYPSGPPQQYPQSPPSYPPQQPQFPGQTPQFPSQSPGPAFSDALGRFRVTLPQGAIPMGATYNFGIPSTMCQVSINSFTQDQMFQMYQQNFPNMLRQMGAKIDVEQPMDVGGRQGRIIAATMRDQTSGNSMSSLNLFISGANIWIQVMGPEQNSQQLGQVLQSIVGGLQF